MTVAAKSLFLCNCNRTMPLDGAALGRALGLPEAPTIHSMLCQRELATFAAGASGDVLAACTQEQRLLGDVAEEGGRTQTIRFVNIRETGGWSAEAPAATPKIAALLAMAALPDPPPVPQRLLRLRRPGADHRSARSRVALGRRAGAQGSASPSSRPGARRAPNCRRSARIPSFPARIASLDRLARRVRRAVDAGQPDRPRPVHALQRVRARVPGTGDRPELPGRPRPLPQSSRVRGGVRRRRRDRLRARGHGAQRTLRPRARPARHAARRAAPAAAGLLRARRRHAGAGQGGRRTRHAHRRVREAEVLQLQGVDLRAQPLEEDRLHAVHRRVLRGGDPAGRRSHRGRAAPVRRLRRLHDGVPVGCADLRLSRRARDGRAHQDAARHVLRVPAGATPACCCTPKTRAARSRLQARRGARPAGARRSRSKSITSPRSASTCGWPRWRGARRRSPCC